MTKYKNDEEYLLIINNIMENEEFQKMSKIKHHNTTRLNHMLKVSYYSYKVAKALRLDYREVARGGLLHDFYTEEISECDSIKEKVLLFSIKHPKEAAENASNYFDLSEKEINIIKSHMFPLDYKIPKYAESWVVSLVDKVLSIGEVSKKFRFWIVFKLVKKLNI